MNLETAGLAPKREKRRKGPITPEQGLEVSGEIAPDAEGSEFEEKSAKAAPAEDHEVDVSDLIEEKPETPKGRLRSVPPPHPERAKARKKAEAPIVRRSSWATAYQKLKANYALENLQAKTAEQKMEAAKRLLENVRADVQARSNEIRQKLAEQDIDPMELIDKAEQMEKKEGLHAMIEEAEGAFADARKAVEKAQKAKEKALPKIEDTREYADFGTAELLTEAQADAKLEAAEENEEWDSKLREAKLKAAAKPFDRYDEAAWEGRGNVASREAEQVAALRQEIAGGEPVGITKGDIEESVKRAQAMVDGGGLPKSFDVNDYRYLLSEQERIENELETSGWWRARKLRAELKETLKELAPYEQQLQPAAETDYPVRLPEGGRDMSRVVRASGEDLAALGFDKGFAASYETKVRDRASLVDLIDQAGFFKQIGLRRQLKALNEDIGAMEEEIVQKRIAGIRGAEEAGLSPDQLAEKRRKDAELAKRNFIRRKH